MTPEEYGENLSDNYVKNPLPDNSGDFEDVAREYMSEKLNTKVSELVLSVIVNLSLIRRPKELHGEGVHF